jgi:thioredoxin-like negative regulator of GroEL
MNLNLELEKQEDYYNFIEHQDSLIVFVKNECPNCKVLVKVIEKCVSTHPDMVVAKVRSEGNEELLEALDISRVPTTLRYKNGEISDRRSGVMKPAEMISFYYGV